MGSSKNIKIDTQYFSIFELVDGVYAAVEKGKNTGSNAGIVDLGNCTVVFDTFLNIDAAKELKEISERLTGRSAAYVVNSHNHLDHIIGNCLYPDSTTIISSETVRKEIENIGKEFEIEKDQYAVKVKEIEDRIRAAESSSETADLNNELFFLRNLAKRDVSIRVPNLTIEKEIILHGSKRDLHLHAFNAAHSSGDVIAYLPSDSICFMGDLLFAESHPWLGSGNPEQFIDILNGLLNYDVEYFIPGHGRLSTKDDVLLQIQYITEILQLVAGKNSFDEKNYSINDLSPVFKEWRSLCFSWNIQFLIERAKSEGMQN